MNDYLVRILTKNGSIRALACVTTELTAEGARRHKTLPTATAALGRGLTGGVLMGALLKTGQRVSLKLEGNGPLGKVLIEAQSNGEVAGTVGNPEVDLPPRNGKFDVAGALGRAGFLTVTKDLGLKEPYGGTVQLVSSEIAEDLTWYLTESEQTPSAIGLGMYLAEDGTVGAAGGFLIQTLPPQDAGLVDTLMARIEQMPPLTEFFRTGGTPEQLLELLFADIPYDTLEKRALAFRCTCTREKGEKALVAQGRQSSEEIIDREGEIFVTCTFCREEWRFGREDLNRIFADSAAVIPRQAKNH